MCHHGCEVLEMAPHLFGRYGYNLFVAFHIVIFLCLWLHRNDIRFHDFQANVMNVQARVKAIVVLHIERFYQDLLYKSLSHLRLNLRSLQELLASLHLSKALPLPTLWIINGCLLCDDKLSVDAG
ncbi:hypothetical protein Plhal304r1_c014g0053311 [Plasmopara halstedii]